MLRQNLDHDAAVLRTARLGLVRRNRFVFAVADHVDLVQRHLVLLVQIALHGLSAGQADSLVRDLVADTDVLSMIGAMTTTVDRYSST